MSFSSLNNFLDSIVALLSEKLDAGIKVERQFPNKVKPHPLNKITVAIGAAKLISGKQCIGGVLTDSHKGREVTLTVEAAIFVPLTTDSCNAYTIMDRIYDLLLADECFGITQVEHGALSSNRATGSFELHSTITATLYETEE